jgi:hypothetical protein
MTLQPLTCEDYDPRTWKECEWSKGFEGEGAQLRCTITLLLLLALQQRCV